MPPTKESGMFEVPGERLRELRDAEAEWDALRKGLHEIMRLPHGAVSPAVKDIVRRTLKDPYP